MKCITLADFIKQVQDGASNNRWGLRYDPSFYSALYPLNGDGNDNMYFLSGVFYFKVDSKTVYIYQAKDYTTHFTGFVAPLISDSDKIIFKFLKNKIKWH